MTTRKRRQKKRRGYVTPQEAAKLRGDASEDELREYFERRDEHFRSNPKIPDYLEYSPMPLCYRWTTDPFSYTEII